MRKFSLLHALKSWIIYFMALFLLNSCYDFDQNEWFIGKSVYQNFSWNTINTQWWKCVYHPKVYFFMYHYVRDYDQRDTPITHDLSISPNEFREHMKKVHELSESWKISLMNGDSFIEAIRTNCFSHENIWIFSADDGWSDMYSNLYPIINEYRIPFFLGVVTDFLDKSGFISTWELLAMSKNPIVTIASHSVSHIDNSKLEEAQERHEACDSKKILERIIDKEVYAYIYPSGRINKLIDERILNECGYSIAWSTWFGRDYNSSTWSLFNLNRIRIHSGTKKDFFDQLVQGT